MATTYTPPGGARLAEMLDSLPVSTRWVSGHHIVWQTGQQNAPDGVGVADHTHCSAFVASVAQMLGLYVLRPPAHGQELLANAQADWLAGSMTFAGPTAAASGWHSFGLSGTDGVLTAAVTAASAGRLVIAIYKAPPLTDSDGVLHAVSGHVCIVRPAQDASFAPVLGPEVASVGQTNGLSMSMQEAFREHRLAWPASIALYGCDTDLMRDVGAAT